MTTSRRRSVTDEIFKITYVISGWKYVYNTSFGVVYDGLHFSINHRNGTETIWVYSINGCLDIIYLNRSPLVVGKDGKNIATLTITNYLFDVTEVTKVRTSALLLRD